MRNILFLAHRVPFPPDRGDKIRGYNIVRYLSERARVHLVAFAESERELAQARKMGGMLASLALVRRSKPRLLAAAEAVATAKPLSLTAFDHPELRAAVAGVLAEHRIDAIYVFSGQMAQYVPQASGPRVLMDFVDMDSAKFAAYAQTANPLTGWFLRREARLLFRHEAAVADRADASLFVSEAEARLFREASGAANVRAVENGIDTDRFDPAADYDRVATAGPTIVFTGQMDYRPNIEAVRWFTDAILPQVRQRHPTAAFAIVGRNPTGEVRALASRPGVIVTGEVPDVRGWLAGAAAVVAPLRIARGVQNKVLEAMAMARSVVASSAAAEGIDHAGTIRIGADAAEIAQQLGALLDDPAAAAELGTQARARVRARYGWDAALAPLDALLGLSPAPARRNAA